MIRLKNSIQQVQKHRAFIRDSYLTVEQFSVERRVKPVRLGLILTSDLKEIFLNSDIYNVIKVIQQE